MFTKGSPKTAPTHLKGPLTMKKNFHLNVSMHVKKDLYLKNTGGNGSKSSFSSTKTVIFRLNARVNDFQQKSGSDVEAHVHKYWEM